MVEIDTLTLNPNPLVRALGKQSHEFTRADIIHFVAEQGIPMLNLRYLGGDGRLKVLNFAIQSADHLNRILTMGERVDGSSLFDFVDAASSDLYVVPQLRTAFLNPFSELPTLDIMCGFYDVEGNPLASSPQQILRKAQQALEDETGCRLEALGELEYYLFSPAEELFPVEPQRGYHEAGPFSKWEAVRVESLAHLARMGCSVKYAHSEVGNFIADGLQMVQQEIEFLPTDVTRAADEMALAKWVVRRVAHSHGIEVSFSPKIVVGQAGSGMHFHTRLMKDGVNQFSEGAGSPTWRVASSVAICRTLLPSRLSATRSPRPSCGSSHTRRPPPPSAGGTATVPCWCGCRSAGRTSTTACSATPTRRKDLSGNFPTIPRPSSSGPPTAQPTFTCCWRASPSPPGSG